MLDIPRAAGVLKVHYAKELSNVVAADPMMASNTLIGLISRRKGNLVKAAMGSAFAVPIKSRIGQTANKTFAKGQAKAAGNFGQGQYDSFLVPAIEGYAFGRVSGTAICVTQGDTNSFIDALQESTDDAIQAAQQEIAAHSFKSGTGSRGRILAVNASPAYVDVAVSDLPRFEQDMELVAAAADGTGSLRSATALRITAIDWQTGRLSLSGSPVAQSWSAGSGGDYLYVDGDFTADTATKIQGVGAWIPVTAPTLATEPTFMGVARYTNPRLVGIRHDAATSTDTLQAILDATAKISLLSGKVTTHGFCNPRTWAKIAGSLEDSKRTTVENKKYNLSFSAVSVLGSSGEFPLLPDRNVPEGVIYLLNLDHLFLVCAGDEPVKIADEDGQTVRAVPDADAYEVRVRSMVNMACDDPSAQGVIYGVA